MALPVPPVPPTDQLPSGGADQLSPTTLILNYLRSQGTPINPENIRRGVEAAARGDVSGLRSDRPATEAEDQAAMAAAKGGRSGGSGPSSSAQPGPAGNPPLLILARLLVQMNHRLLVHLLVVAQNAQQEHMTTVV